MDRPLYLVVTQFFPAPDNWRGAYCYDFVVALMRTGKYDVRVFVPGRGADYDYCGVRVYKFPTLALPSLILPFLFSFFNKRSFLQKLKFLGLDCANIAICHAHVAFSAIYPLAVKAKNPKCLTLLHHHDLSSFGLNSGRLRHFFPHKVLNFLCLRKYHESIDCHVFISEMSYRSFVSVPDASWSHYSEYHRQMRGLSHFRSPRIAAKLILHNGVDSGLFQQPDVSKAAGFVVGCVANFDKIKSQITLLKALNLLKDEFPAMKIRFVGTGAYLHACRDYVAANGLSDRVSFEVEREHSLLPQFYREIDLFVLPSYFEGFGCVFTEAHMCGVPFITCQGQGIEDLIPPEEYQTWLCRPKDAGSLAEKIRGFFLHRPKQHLIGATDINELVANFVSQIEKLRIRD